MSSIALRRWNQAQRRRTTPVPPNPPTGPWWQNANSILLPANNKVIFGYYNGGSSTASQQGQWGRGFDLTTFYNKNYTASGMTSALTSWRNSLSAGCMPRVEFDFSQYSKSYGGAVTSHWTDIANGNFDADFTYGGNTIRGIDYSLKQVMSLGTKVFVSLYHEMDQTNETGGDGTNRYGTAAQFRAAWQHIIGRARTIAAGDATLIEPVWFFNPAAGHAADTSGEQMWGTTLSDTGSNGLYPGHQYVDWVGADPYNWAGTHNSIWYTPQNTSGGNFYQVVLTWWKAHFTIGGVPTAAQATSGQGVYKPMMYGETSTMEKYPSSSGISYSGDAGDAQVWMNKLADYVDVGGAAHGIVMGMCWFGRDYYPTNNGNYDWTAGTGLLGNGHEDWSIREPTPGTVIGTPQKWLGLQDIGQRLILQL